MPNKKYKGTGEVHHEIQIFIRKSSTITELIDKTNNYINNYKETKYLPIEQLNHSIGDFMRHTITKAAYSSKTLNKKLPWLKNYGNFEFVHYRDPEQQKIAIEQVLICTAKLNWVKKIIYPKDKKVTLEEVIGYDKDIKTLSEFLNANPFIAELIFTSYSGYVKRHDFISAAKGKLKIDGLAPYINTHYSPKQNTLYLQNKLKEFGGTPKSLLTVAKMVNNYFKTQIEKSKKVEKELSHKKSLKPF